jgi:excinuclease ABC subunit C
LPQVLALPTGPGVYRFRDESGKALYIGRATDLRRRVASYWGNLRDRPRLRRMVARVARVEALECASEHEAAWLERNLLEQSKPRWNRIVGGLEVEVYIGLHDCLEVRHAPGGRGLVFGPYLGGDKVRLAVSGLHRVIPLAYAGERLGGSDREMARVRVVAPGSRSELAEALVAVLNRDLTAAQWVRTELEARRDGASEALAYELAARIHAEREALDWVLAEQKATRPDAGRDGQVHGWADGILVSLHIRQGRVRSWTQQLCEEPAAKAKVDTTPDEWRHFARRNAVLAARLVEAASG